MVIALVWSNWGPKSSAVRRAQFWSRLYIFSTRGPKFGPASRTQIWHRQLTQVCYCSRPNSWTYLCLNTTNNASQSRFSSTHISSCAFNVPYPKPHLFRKRANHCLRCSSHNPRQALPYFWRRTFMNTLGKLCHHLVSTRCNTMIDVLVYDPLMQLVFHHIFMRAQKVRKTQSLSPGPPLAPPVQTMALIEGHPQPHFPKSLWFLGSCKKFFGAIQSPAWSPLPVKSSQNIRHHTQIAACLAPQCC